MTPEPIDGWKPLLRSLGASAEGALDDVRERFRRRFRADRRLHVIAYRGFGNRTRGTLSGRVLAYREPPDGDPGSLWHSLQQSYRRFETDEVPDVRVARARALNLARVHEPVLTPWSDLNVRLRSPNGLQITLFQTQASEADKKEQIQ